MLSKSAFSAGLLKLLAFLRIPRRRKFVTDKVHSNTTAQLLHLAQPGQTVFWLGVHEASMLYFLSQKVGDTGIVVAFEPHPAVLLYLSEVRQVMGWTNIRIDPTPFWIPPSSGRGNRPHQETKHKGALVIPFETRRRKMEASALLTLDRYCEREEVYPDVLSINAEGYELQILKGSVELLQTRKPLILVNCNEQESGWENMRALFSFLAALGYKGYLMQDSKALPVEDFSFECSGNAGPGTGRTCFRFSVSPGVDDLS